MPRARSRRLITSTTQTGVTVEFKKCRKCLKDQRPKEYYIATDTFIDADGLFSVCKTCMNNIFDTYLESEKSIEKAVLRLCRSMNIKYDDGAIQAALSHQEQMKEKGKIIPPFFSMYKLKLSTASDVKMADRKNLDLTYQEVTNITISGLNTLDNYNPDEIDPEVIQFWGEGLQLEDYRWLEIELDDWKATHKADTKAERTLLKEIVRKQFAIEKANRNNTPSGNLVKELQEIMKTAAIDPSKANAASAGRTDTFGGIIKMIEDTQPADYYKDKSLFKDFDNINSYFQKYVVRAIKNFITGSRDFSTEVEADDGDDTSLETVLDVIAEPEENGEENGN